MYIICSLCGDRNSASIIVCYSVYEKKGLASLDIILAIEFEVILYSWKNCSLSHHKIMGGIRYGLSIISIHNDSIPYLHLVEMGLADYLHIHHRGQLFKRRLA